MKILHLNSYYFKRFFYKNLFEKQIEMGLSINVFIPVDYNSKEEFDFGTYSTICKCFRDIDKYTFFTKQSKVYNSIITEYDIPNYDIIHAHSVFSNGFSAYRLYKHYSIPYIVVVRNTDVNVFFKKVIFLRKLGIRILNSASKIIFLSDTYKNTLLSKYIPKRMRDIIDAKCVVIPNGIDKYWHDNSFNVKDFKTLKDPIKLVQVGELNKNKNLLKTIKACEILSNNGISIKLYVIGRIINRKVYKYLQKSSIAEYLGYLNKEDVLNVFRQSDIFILPSFKESFGLVYAEALSQALPIVYSQNQGFDNQFKDGFVGYSVNPKSAPDISEKITMIIDNYKSISSRCIIASDTFSWEIISKKYMEIYKEIKNS